jgi:hypothetical protein
MSAAQKESAAPILVPEYVARALGGKVESDTSVRAPGPGCEPGSGSMIVFINPRALNGFRVHSHSGQDWNECMDYVCGKLGLQRVRQRAENNKSAFYVYKDEHGQPYARVKRFYVRGKKQFAQELWTGSEWKGGKGCMKGVAKIPYRLPELIASGDQPIFLCEGEKDADRVASSLGLVATTASEGAMENAHKGKGKWRAELNKWFTGRVVYVLPDNDKPGHDHANDVARHLSSVASAVHVVHLLGLPSKGDVSDWIDDGGDAAGLWALAEAAPRWAANDNDPSAEEPEAEPDNDNAEEPRQKVFYNQAVELKDFYSYAETRSYLCVPSRQLWPAGSVNSRLPPVLLTDKHGKPKLNKKGEPIEITPCNWLDMNRSVEQMTWAPGMPLIIEDHIIAEGGWVPHKNWKTANLYRPPTLKLGNASKAGLWVDHAHKVYPSDADHIIRWFAQRVQKPQIKINHGLMLGGVPGIGKDSLLEPVKQAVGHWNFTEASPKVMMGRFNSFVKSVILRVSEICDLGDVDRYTFYEHLKVYAAAPPDVLRCDEKNLREHSVPNCTGVIITTNHKTDGLYLPADDRRHYVAWSDLTRDDFPTVYFDELYSWYEGGGNGHVAAYLTELDITGFNPKAPPTKTEAFWAIVDANRAPEDAELADVLDDLGNPNVVTLKQIASRAEIEFAVWIKDRKNRRVIPHRLEQCGYVRVRNEAADDGYWKIHGARQAVYAKSTLSPQERLRAVHGLSQSKLLVG